MYGHNNGIGFFVPVIGIAGLVASIFIGPGPIDLTRSVYNHIIGDTPVLKRELLNYSRKDIQIKNPKHTFQQVESSLANELNYKLEGEKINHLDVSVEKLWGASENHAKSLYQKWVWPSLNE